MKIWVRGTAVHEGKHSKHSAASTTSLKITSFQAFPFRPMSTGRKPPQPHPRQAHSQHEAGHVSPHAQGNFQTPREEGPEERTVCHQQHYSSPWSWGGIAVICSVTCGDKGHPPRQGGDGKKDRDVLLLHRTAVWKTRRDGFKLCFDHMAP